VNYIAPSFPTLLAIKVRNGATQSPMSLTNIFALVSTLSESIFGLSIFVFSIMAVIYVVVLAYWRMRW